MSDWAKAAAEEIAAIWLRGDERAEHNVTAIAHTIRRYAPEAEGWRTIDSAPRDGTHILIWCPVETRIVSSWWREQPKTEGGGGWYGTDPMDRLNWIQYPTHWRPLPNPPEGAS